MASSHPALDIDSNTAFTQHKPAMETLQASVRYFVLDIATLSEARVFIEPTVSISG